MLGCIVGLLPVPVSARGTLELLALLLILASPTLVFRAWRPGKWFTRLLPSALSTFLVMHAVRRPELPGLIVALLVVALGILGMLCYRGHGPDRRICSVCPEFSSPTTCSGFAPIRRRERAFRRLAARWMDG